jgi:hypothetical protein
MRTSMSLEEFAELVQMPPAEISELAEAGLLDPAGEGRFDDFDLLRLMALRHYEALGYDSERFSRELGSGELEPFLGEYLYPLQQPLTVGEAGERVGVDHELLDDMLIALGWSRRGFLEEDLRMLEGSR